MWPIAGFLLPLGLFLLANLKVLPGVWHLRILHGIYTQTHAPAISTSTSSSASSAHGSKSPVFQYMVTTTRAAPLECDYNGHKSNSTYFSDLDVNRTQLLARLFRPVLSASHYHRSKRARHLNIALGSTGIGFRRQIRPLQECAIWSRVLAWDKKWIYVVSYFIDSPSSSQTVGPTEENILASGIARYVFKDERKTVSPHVALTDCDFLSVSAQAIEDERAKGMRVAALLGGLEELPAEFRPENGRL